MCICVHNCPLCECVGVLGLDGYCLPIYFSDLRPDTKASNNPLTYTHTHTHTSPLSNFNLAAIYTEAIFLIIRPATFCENTRGSVTPACASITFPLSSFPLQQHSPIVIVLPSAIDCSNVPSKHFTDSDLQAAAKFNSNLNEDTFKKDYGRAEIQIGRTLETVCLDHM